MEKYEKSGKSIPYLIQRKQIKNTYFRYRNGYLMITTNPKTKIEQIVSFMDQHFDRFYEKFERAKQMELDNEITLWGTPYRMVKSYGKFSYEMIGNTLYVDSRIDDIIKIKHEIYKHEMIQRINEVIPEVNRTIHLYNISPVQIKLKYLKSKFGSYHKKNKEITLNTFLSRLDPIYLYYVLYHEYAHVLVFNHSKDFYNLLGDLMPNHRQYQKDLKKIAIL
ncbi:MAG: M48 family metallopeptidase [Firmicutes bacterium]|nr:M48 family metallopeptidase [Bacillota bacterium]